MEFRAIQAMAELLIDRTCAGLASAGVNWPLPRFSRWRSAAVVAPDAAAGVI
jgi:hypothetical protein